MRELPLSPVEALRLELRSRDRQGASICSQTGGVEAKHAKGVEYFPSRLTADEGITEGSEHRTEQQGPRTGSDLGVLKAKLLDVQRREQDIIGTGLDPLCLTRATNDEVISQRREADRKILSDSRGSRIQRRLGPDRRPSSSGPGRRPLIGAHVEEASSLFRRCASELVECPSGCGEEVRLSDVGSHQESACTLR